jgi:hypothetical protein
VTGKCIAKLKVKKATSIKNSKYVPSNATIRQEYVKCGKWDCPRYEHSPYYYAYWKENAKLRKKYIREYPPQVENLKKHKSGHKDEADSTSMVTVTDPSNTHVVVDTEH